MGRPRVHVHGTMQQRRQGEEFGGRDPFWFFVHDGPHLITEVRKAAEEANHYKGFNVGGIAVVASNEGDILTIPAANQNLSEEDENWTKMCAERINWATVDHLEKAFAIVRGPRGPQKRFQVIANFVSGPVQPDKQSGLVTHTLHSCGLEREIMPKLKILRPDTLYVTVRPDEDIFEAYMQKTVLAMHALPGQIPPKSHSDQGFENWSNATPLYESAVAQYQEQGLEVPHAQLALWAVTGVLQSGPLEAD